MIVAATAQTRFRVVPATRGLRGSITVPGDKSIGHRAVILAALGMGRSRLRGLSGGQDNRRTVRAFQMLGVPILDEGPAGLQVWGHGWEGLWSSAHAIDCGNSGTTMRLLAGVLAGCGFETILDGDEYLQSRPMGRIVAPLSLMGARITGRAVQSLGQSIEKKSGESYAPLIIGAAIGRLVGVAYDSPISSAQVKSAILLAGLQAEGITRVREPSISRDHTERMLRALGAPVVVENQGEQHVVTLDPAGWNRALPARDLMVPGDFSSAAFVLGAALLVQGSDVVVRGVGLNPTRTGALDALRAMGGDLTVENARDESGEPVGDVRARASSLRGIRIDGELALRAIDELPLLAAIAAHADGETVIADAAELRVKESDRIAAMAAALSAFGVLVEERPDGLLVAGKAGAQLMAAQVESRGDHRIAMASAICALRAAGESRIDDVANVATSFPNFRSMLGELGATVAEERA